MCCVFDRSLDIFNNITYKHFERHTLYCIFWWYRFVSGHISSRNRRVSKWKISPWARQKAIGKQPPYKAPVACSVWGKDRAFNRNYCDVHHIHHHRTLPDHGDVGAISQPPLAGEPLNKGRLSHHIYPWAPSTCFVNMVFQIISQVILANNFFRCSYWSEP